MDLRKWFGPIVNQYPLNSCTAHAAVALSGYYQNRVYGRQVQGSRLFLYKIERNLLGESGDGGAFLRTAMEALRLFGVVPEQFWPYIPGNLDVEPPDFSYALAANYKASKYYRLDAGAVSTTELLGRIRANIAAELPVMFGFIMYPSLAQAQKSGQIPYPSSSEKPISSHAVVALGYDDSLVIENAPSGSPASKTTGALLIRNSWGSEWGDAGYGWLPYQYVINGIATDWWSLISADFADIDAFGVQ